MPKVTCLLDLCLTQFYLQQLIKCCIWLFDVQIYNPALPESVKLAVAVFCYSIRASEQRYWMRNLQSVEQYINEELALEVAYVSA